MLMTTDTRNKKGNFAERRVHCPNTVVISKHRELGRFFWTMTKEIRLTNGAIALVDDDDYEYLNQWQWCYRRGYAMRHLSRVTGEKRMNFMHLEIAKIPEGMETDHRDRNKLNNQRDNLRICTPSQNKMNRGKQKNNTSGYKGVSWHRKDNKWRAYIGFNHSYFHLGNFDNAKDAARAYDEKARELFGEFAETNFQH